VEKMIITFSDRAKDAKRDGLTFLNPAEGDFHHGDTEGLVHHGGTEARRRQEVIFTAETRRKAVRQKRRFTPEARREAGGSVSESNRPEPGLPTLAGFEVEPFCGRGSPQAKS
jgi:hypothetical protein